MLTPGTATDRWDVLALLGQGGMARVYHVRDRHRGTDHVLKVLHAPSASGRFRILREGQVQSRMLHPNVVEVTDVVEIEGAPALVMELVDGPSLDRLIPPSGLPLEVANALVSGICAGLTAAHQAGAVHRDLKPANVLISTLDDRLTPKIADFGLVKQLGVGPSDAQTLSGATLGTPRYMAPEQVRATRDVDARADVWALGVMLYEMVTGRRPFEGATSYAVFEAIVARRFVAPQHVKPGLPAGVLAAIDACLQPWAERAASVAEVADLWGAEASATVPDSWLARARALGNRSVTPAEDTWVAEATSHTQVASHSGQGAPHQLPKERDRFVGRLEDLDALAERLRSGARLVSVLGFGGAGKTRLATRFGWRQVGAYDGGVWFCDLSEARDVGDIVHAVARGLDLPLGPGDPVELLGEVLAARGPCLLILDNFEQVTAHAGGTLGRWLARTTEARFVVTSRERLHLPDEQVLSLNPLPAPEAVALFVARAAQAKPGFALPDPERPHVEALVRLLDGLPLAIELAAARASVFSPEALLQRMTQRFRLLTSAGHKQPSTRHGNLRAVLDWSWELLEPDEQAALAQLAVFDGGWTVEAAEHVVVLEDLWAADALQALLDQSLVIRADHGRFDLLVSVKAYASEQLDRMGTRADTEARHGDWFARLGQPDALAGLERAGGTQKHQALATELANLQTAGRRAAARGDTVTAVPALRAAWEAFHLSGPAEPTLALASAVESLVPPDSADALHVHVVTARALRFAGRPDEAQARLASARSIAQTVHDPSAEAHIVSLQAVVACERGDLSAARALGEAAVVLAQRTGDRALEGIALGHLGIVDVHEGQLEAARANLEGALAAHRTVGNRLREGNVLGNLGAVRLHQGRAIEARALYDAALRVHREVGNRRAEGNVLVSLGILDWKEAQPEAARRHYQEGLRVFREVHNRRGEGNAQGHLAILDAEQGRFGDAKEHFDAALAIHREVGNQRLVSVALGNLGELHLRIGQLAEARGYFEEALAIAIDIGNERTEGTVLSHLGHLLAREDRGQEARATYERAEAVLRRSDEMHDLGLLLARRALLELPSDGPLARAYFDEAASLAQTLSAAANSPLGQALDEARTAIAASPDDGP